MRHMVKFGVQSMNWWLAAVLGLVACTPANENDGGQGGAVAAASGGAVSTGKGGAVSTAKAGAAAVLRGGATSVGNGGAIGVASGGVISGPIGGTTATGKGGTTSPATGGAAVVGTGGMQVSNGGTIAATGGNLVVATGGTSATGGSLGTAGGTAQPPVLDFSCQSDADCCVALYGCMAQAWLVTKTQKPALESYLATLPHDMCVACISPAVQVACVAGQCTGTKLALTPATMPYVGAHCGALPISSGGAAGASGAATAYIMAIATGGAAGNPGTGGAASGGSVTKWNCGG